MKCRFPYIFIITLETAAVTGIYPCVVQPHNFNRICLKWDRSSNKKQTVVSICHLHMSSSVDYLKPLILNRNMSILERSFGYFFIIQAFCKLPSHFTKCLVILQNDGFLKMPATYIFGLHSCAAVTSHRSFLLLPATPCIIHIFKML